MEKPEAAAASYRLTSISRLRSAPRRSDVKRFQATFAFDDRSRCGSCPTFGSSLGESHCSRVPHVALVAGVTIVAFVTNFEFGGGSYRRRTKPLTPRPALVRRSRIGRRRLVPVRSISYSPRRHSRLVPVVNSSSSRSAERSRRCKKRWGPSSVADQASSSTSSTAARF